MAVAVSIAATAAAACGDSGEDAGEARPERAATEVVIDLVAFKPENLSVEAGDEVVWRQRDAGNHTVTSGTVAQGAAGVTAGPDGRFDSGEIAAGATFRHRFAEPGTYAYFCALHPATMRGEIRVS